jgi:hypothetical protein
MASGFRYPVDPEVAQAWLDAAKERWPGRGVQLFLMLRDTRREIADQLDVSVLWFGHEWFRGQVRMWPVSKFPGPETMSPASVPSCAWARVTVVLTNQAGDALPDSVQKALREHVALQLTGSQHRGSFSDQFSFRSGTVPLPCGDFTWVRFDLSSSQFRPVATCRVDPDTHELRLAIPDADRMVRLELRGVPDPGYLLEVQHENGRVVREFGNATRRHVLWLPTGACTLTVKRGTAREPEVAQHTVVVTDAIEQDVVFDVPPKRR